MTMNVPQRKLKIVGSALETGSRFSKAVRELHNKNLLKLVETKHDRIFSYYEWDHPKATFTFDRCIDLELDHNNGDQRVILHVWDGDNYRGDKTKKRNTYIFQGEWWKSLYITEALERKFLYYCDWEVEREAEEARKLKVQIMGQTLLHRAAWEEIEESNIKPGPVTQV